MKKIFCIYLLLSFLLGFSSCVMQQESISGIQENSVESMSEEENVSRTEDFFALPSDVPQEYATVLSQYREIVRIMTSDEVGDVYSGKSSLPRPDGVNFDDWASGLLGWGSLPSRYGYLVKDINNDGISELFWVREDYEILLAFTISNGKIVGLFSSCPRDYVYLSDSGKLVNLASGGADVGRYVVMSLPSQSDRLIVEEIVDYDVCLNEAKEYIPEYHTVLWKGTLDFLEFDDKAEAMEKSSITKDEFDAFREKHLYHSFPSEAWKQNYIYFI